VGCCWLLFLVLVPLGIMNIAAMIAVTLVVFAEKVLPGGERTARVLALALIALGVWIALAPESVPGLTIPSQHGVTIAAR
jgi:predicted metal-binding membrane protein